MKVTRVSGLWNGLREIPRPRVWTWTEEYDDAGLPLVSGIVVEISTPWGGDPVCAVDFHVSNFSRRAARIIDRLSLHNRR